MTLSILWFILIAVLWIGYLTLEGFDFGVGMLLKILGRDERERRATLATIGPHWDGNEVWLLTAGGATFAAFPEWYSTLFSGAYIVLFIILLCLIVRVCAIEWRPKVNSQTWRDRWDWVHTISAWLPSILWGVAFANLVQGMHIEVVQTSNGAVVPASQVPADSLVPGAAHQITGGLLTMVTPFTLLGGVVTCLLFLNHGALFVALKTTGDLSQRALGMSRRLARPPRSPPPGPCGRSWPTRAALCPGFRWSSPLPDSLAPCSWDALGRRDGPSPCTLWGLPSPSSSSSPRWPPTSCAPRWTRPTR